MDKNERKYRQTHDSWSVDRTSRQKINRNVKGVNNTINQIDLIDMYRLLQLANAEHMLFPSAHGSFSKIYHILSHTGSINKF